MVASSLWAAWNFTARAVLRQPGGAAVENEDENEKGEEEGKENENEKNEDENQVEVEAEENEEDEEDYIEAEIPEGLTVGLKR